MVRTVKRLATLGVLAAAAGCGGESSTPSARDSAEPSAYVKEQEERGKARARFCGSASGRGLEQAGTDFTVASNNSDEAGAVRFYKKAIRLGRQAPRGSGCAYSGLSQIAFVLLSAQNNLPDLDVDAMRRRVERLQRQEGLDEPLP